MKKTPLLAKLRLILILCCVVVLAARIYKHHVMSTKLESVLSFEELEVDQCTIGPPFYDSQMTVLDPDEADPFAKQFASQVRKHFKEIHDGLFEYKFTHVITFKDNDSTWEFMFGYVPHEAFLEYRTTTSPLKGTILLHGGVGPQLQALIERFAAEEPNTQSSAGNVDATILDIRKDPNAYYDGCVSCTLAIEERGFLFRRIFVEATFKNETDYPIPIEKHLFFISIDGKPNVMENATFEVHCDGKEVSYLGILIKRRRPEFPEDYYILAAHSEYTSVINLSKYYDIPNKGKCSVKYWALNGLEDKRFVDGAWFFEIESDSVEFEK